MILARRSARSGLKWWRGVSSWNVKGIEYRQIERSHDPEKLFQFNKTHGSTPHNFIPDGPVREHFGKLATGETVVWGAFSSGELVGLISSEDGGGYWKETGHGEQSSSFINEFVVNPNLRGKSIGKHLTKISVDPELGIFGIKPSIKEMYTTFHQGNIGSRTAFIKGGNYVEVLTYEDAFRKRNTTVAKFVPTVNVVPRIPRDNVEPEKIGHSWHYRGIEYRAIERSYDSEALFQFNKQHGSTPHNFIPDGPVREHLAKIASGETVVWGAFENGQLVGFISGETGGGYWTETGFGSDSVCFINEFVVNPECRGKNIGKVLTKISVDSELGIFGINPHVHEMYTTFHADNLGSRTAFMKGGGFNEVLSYQDAFRERSTTVAKFTRDSAMMPVLKSSGDGTIVDPSISLGFGCPTRSSAPDACHVLEPLLDDSWWQKRLENNIPCIEGSKNPFVRFRDRLFVYRFARSVGLSDAEYLTIVDELDSGLQRVEPSGPGGFKETPLKYHKELNVWGKDESGQIGQSHKARHFGCIMLYLQVLLRSGAAAAKDLREKPLSVASCGNAALAAATVAAAAKWPILVYVPDDAEPAVMARLAELNAMVQVCPKADNAKYGGDATVHHFRQSVEEGALAFSVQATDNGLAAEGGCTIIWEALEQLKEQGSDLGSVVIQVGGGAMASGLFSGLEQSGSQAELHTVQGEGCAPLSLCMQKIEEQLPVTQRSKEEVQAFLAKAAKSERSYMNVWPDPWGLAHGIQDDETYDWLKVTEAMLRTGGSAQVVADSIVQEAWDSAHEATGINMCSTGASGFAGVLKMRAAGCPPKEPTLCIFSGLHRGSDRC